MKNEQNNIPPLMLDDIWNNVFNKLCDVIIGNENKIDYFVIDEGNETFLIVRTTNQEEQWECMLDSSVSQRFKKRDGNGRYSKEYEKFVSDILSGNIISKSKGKYRGNSYRYTNLRYRELLEYLVVKGTGIITKEIEFVKNTIINSCMLKFYLEEKTKNGNIVNETQVSKDELSLYRNRVRVDFVENLITDYLSKTYSGFHNIKHRNPLEMLAIVILRALCEISISSEDTGVPLKNEKSILDLQKQFAEIIEEYLNSCADEIIPEINVSLAIGWEDKLLSVQKVCVDDLHFAENSDFVSAIKNTYSVRMKEIYKATIGIGFKDRMEIVLFWQALREEFEKFSELLDGLQRIRDLENGRENNRLEEQNIIEEIVQDAARSLHLRFENREDR